MSDFEDVGNALKAMLQRQISRGFLRQVEPCPECGEPMVAVVSRETNQLKCRPACPACGFAIMDGSINTAESNAKKWTDQARQNDAINYLQHSSEVVDHDLFSKTLDNFETTNNKQRQALTVARRTVDDILAGQPAHCMFTGATGTGKSHLAMGILYAVMVGSNYTKKCAFIDYRELLRQIKRGFNIDEARKYADMITEEVRRADVVVIDDLGSEAGDANSNYQSSAWGTDVATGIFAARENKPTIITTNRVGTDLKRIYGDRVVSRITHHIDGRVMLFNGMDDYRVKQEA